MKKYFSKGYLATFIVIAVLIIDQIIKILVKTNMYWHESIRITDWFYIYFTENNGMAFGMEIFDKLFLTRFRLIASVGITYLLYRFVKRNLKTGFIACVALILAGALGNIIDCVFYGEITACFMVKSSAKVHIARLHHWYQWEKGIRNGSMAKW